MRQYSQTVKLWLSEALPVDNARRTGGSTSRMARACHQLWIPERIFRPRLDPAVVAGIRQSPPPVVPDTRGRQRFATGPCAARVRKDALGAYAHIRRRRMERLGEPPLHTRSGGRVQRAIAGRAGRATPGLGCV